MATGSMRGDERAADAGGQDGPVERAPLAGAIPSAPVEPVAPEERGEFALLARLRHALDGRAGPGEVHLGDDAAVLAPPPGRLLLSTDLMVEGVHFDLGLGSLVDAGWKAVASNVSDIAAMGGIATHCVAAVGAPPGMGLDPLFDGMREAASSFGVELVGGDLSSSAQLVVSIAIIGGSGDFEPVLRDGARPGDELWCTGPLGGSAAGLQLLRRAASATDGQLAAIEDALVRSYLRPVARPREGRLLASLGARAMIDVSDGLAQDVAHLGTASDVGIELDVVPVAEGATEDQALGGGEDYELVFAVASGSDVTGAFAAAGLRSPIRIGRCTQASTVRLLRGEPLPQLGWAHDVG